MTTLTAAQIQMPSEVGGNIAYTSVSDGVLVFPAIAGARYLVLWRNTGGSASVPTFDDPTSATPVGAVAFNPDLVGASVPITTGATGQMLNSTRLRDASGNVNATMTNAASLVVAVIGPL